MIESIVIILVVCLFALGGASAPHPFGCCCLAIAVILTLIMAFRDVKNSK